MGERVEKSGLQVDAALAAFIDSEILAPLGRDAPAFWAGFPPKQPCATTRAGFDRPPPTGRTFVTDETD